MSTPAHVQVVLRPIGSPLTVGMSGLAVASLVQSGAELRWIPQNQTPEVGVILIAMPFLLQLIACVVSYLARDAAAGAALGLLASTWLALGLVDLLTHGSQVNPALGLMLIAVALLLFCSAVAVAVGKPLPATVFVLASVRFLLAGVYQLSAVSAWKHVSGVLGLVILAAATYTVLAFELEGQRHTPLLPTFRRHSAATPRAPGPAIELDQLAREPGVRPVA